MNIRRILIANRGEIAVRIFRSCQRLGIETVLAASAADLDALAARMAGSVINLGPAPAAASYLNLAAVLQAARTAQVDAVHPGYGFLSEKAALAQACEAAGIRFIGPTAAQLTATGDKLLARQHAEAAGLPLLPGGPTHTVEDARALAGTLGYPVLIKAVGGGGGRGMKVVDSAATLAAAFELATAEAAAAFADPRLYLEPYVKRGRHVEVQLLGDGSEVIHLGTRDCSIQRRYQKLVEEAPAPDLPDAQRQAIEMAAVKFGRHLGYRSAGTVEFLYDTERQCSYFLEMNARIQVEHPVTEAITGIDLVAEQIRIAEGRPLRHRQQDIELKGHAIECRLNAEDCAHDFRPSPGLVTQALFAAGAHVRVDTHIESGSSVPPYYDSLLAKLIVWGKTRTEAVTRLRAALDRCELAGVASNLPLHRAILNDAGFCRGGVDTRFLDALLMHSSFADTTGGHHG